MMLNAPGSGSLDDLITFMEYMSVAKNRVKELRELRSARDAAIDERKAIEKAHGGARALAEAENTLAKARTTASEDLAKAETAANQLIVDANSKVGNLIGTRKGLDTLGEKLNKDRISFDETSAETIKELVRREERATKKENDNARNREELAQERSKMQEKSQRVITAMNSKE